MIYDADGHKIGIKSGRSKKIPARNETPTFGGSVDHSEAAAKMLAKTSEQKVVELRAMVEESGAHAYTGLFDAHFHNIEDGGLHYSERFLAALHVLASQMPTEQDAIELIDMVCAGAARKIERKDRDIAKLAREYQAARESDTVTEIGSLALSDAEERLNTAREQADMWQAVFRSATRAYEQTAYSQWQDRTTTPRDRVNVTDEAARWESAVRQHHLNSKVKVVIVGGNDVPASEVKQRIDRMVEKVGADKLAILTGDSESGFERMVRDYANGLGTLAIAVPLADRQAKDRFFRRNESFMKYDPKGVVVMGGGGVQGHVIELARKANITVDVPTCPKGWVRDNNGLRKIS
jgi:hypothetical protein